MQKTVDTDLALSHFRARGIEEPDGGRLRFVLLWQILEVGVFIIKR